MAVQGSKPRRYIGKEENMQRKDIKMLVNKWWEIYNDPSLDFSRADVIPNAQTLTGLQQVTENSLLAAIAPIATPALRSLPPAA